MSEQGRTTTYDEHRKYLEVPWSDQHDAELALLEQKKAALDKQIGELQRKLADLED